LSQGLLRIQQRDQIRLQCSGYPSGEHIKKLVVKEIQYAYLKKHIGDRVFIDMYREFDFELPTDKEVLIELGKEKGFDSFSIIPSERGKPYFYAIQTVEYGVSENKCTAKRLDYRYILGDPVGIGDTNEEALLDLRKREEESLRLRSPSGG
jgi:hypothetical protein